MMGIFLSIQQALEKGETRITVVTDSMSSVMSIKNSINNSGKKYFENFIIKTCDENQQAHMNIVWIPAHTNKKPYAD